MDHNTFITGLARQLGKDVQEVDSLVGCLAKTIKENASELDSVAIPGFGRFDAVKNEEYISTDLSTGRRILFPPEIKFNFTAGSMLKKRFSHE